MLFLFTAQSSVLSPQSSVLSPPASRSIFFCRFRLPFLLPLLVAASGCRFWLPFLVAVLHDLPVCAKLSLPIHYSRRSPVSIHPATLLHPWLKKLGFSLPSVHSSLSVSIRVHPWFKKLVFSLLTIHVHPYPSVVEEVGFSLFTGVSHVT